MTRPLTQREADALRYAADGYPVRVIAARLALAASTVHTTLRRAVRALGARSVDHAIQIHHQPAVQHAPGPAAEPSTEETSMTITIGIAQREGTGGPCADAAATHTSARSGRTAAAVVDGIGHSPDIVALAPLLAQSAARAGAATDALTGILTAGLLADGPGHPDAVAVLAVTRPDGDVAIAWAGDSAAYHWDGAALNKVTTDHNLASYLAEVGQEPGLAEQFSDFLLMTLGHATALTVHHLVVPAGLLILTSDGVHDQIDHPTLHQLVSRHQHSPQALADALVAAAEPDATGYRDDATAVVLCSTTTIAQNG